MSKKLHDLDFTEGVVVAIELAKIQGEFSKAIFKLAKEYGLDDIELLNMASKVVLDSTRNPEFVENVAPTIREELEEEE